MTHREFTRAKYERLRRRLELLVWGPNPYTDDGPPSDPLPVEPRPRPKRPSPLAAEAPIEPDEG